MSLSPSKSTVSAVAPVFAKVFEMFTGGFSLTTTGFNTGVKLPAGALLRVSESARTATPIKTTRLTAVTTGATAIEKTYYFAADHHFQVGDYFGHSEGTGARGQTITAIESASTGSKVTATGPTAARAAVNAVIYETATGATSTIKTVANTVSAYEVEIESGAFVTALRRGTAYKNRVQPHVAGHLADINASIQFSESY